MLNSGLPQLSQPFNWHILDRMAASTAAHSGFFTHDAAERARMTDKSILRSVRSLDSVRTNFADTHLKIRQSEVLISAADRLILALGRELISCPDSSAT